MEETFNFFSAYWNVSKAKQIVANKKVKLDFIVVANWTSLLGRFANGKIKMGITVNWNEINSNSSKFDLTVPVIVAHHDNFKFMVIDGWHRIARAETENVLKLPAFCLSKKDSNSILLK